ncbi:DEAD/DEAH box helicase [Ceratocystis lukuohia]|uniref:RNA helicase n=2 Tax=Ceratocystis TaxID=5157 RepID=A0A2C5WWB8_9PEZI|nr:ATP-dependent RNA helicase mrh4, mitochondrial [Ceratocystis fimbriata CBS 114723]
MLSALLRPVCPKCTLPIAISTRLSAATFLPGVSSTTIVAGSTRGYAFGRRTVPSRMVLSKTVDRPPMKAGKMNKRMVEGPFGSMNQTVARLPSKAARVERHRRQDDERHERKQREYFRRDDRKALKMQQSLSTMPYSRRNDIKDRMVRFESFDQFDLLPQVRSAIFSDALRGLVDIKPTPAQRLAIPAILSQSKAKTRREYLIAAETGSGKTLAYLVPAINALKIAESEDPEIADYKERQRVATESVKDNKSAAPFDEPHPTMARPKVVVLVPTAELVDQVGNVAKTLAHEAKFKTEKLSSQLSPLVIHRNLYSPRGVDLIVTTPHLLASIVKSDPNVLARVTDLIIDEADSLFDRSFTPVTTTILEKSLPSVKRLVVCSATIPKRLDKYLGEHYPDMIRITTPNLHAIPRRVQLGVIDVSRDPYRNNKDLACADAIYSIGRDAMRNQDTGGATSKDGAHEVRRIMVFVNEREKTEELAEYLKSKGIKAVALNRDTLEQRYQAEALNEFTTSKPIRIPESLTGIKPGKSLPNVKVIVATDLMSRGIDTVAVRHVILYDVPHTTIDFVHRLGRAGRMGRRGRGVVLVGNDDRKDVVAEVKNSMFMGQALI